ncbi:ATP-grasp domain-containing protein [Salisediminibacterium halotolerans]|uniref:ATP-grasp domain-containing protein n=1 Tax=Salisediminibacterium halotolerans TaxID=517425 RepID=UPI000EB2FAE4|nr:RimK family alpha-L-glutamate ligase [Salisediminibacterium halotolerans]RLJ78238.1 SSU ribosomal protein S6P modification protein [Actinophytocola xinjiangensis]RPE88423.1 SSU ribosomal protein S6P modification protein [Salisediminibacterium halotolerans]TWG37215.1 SSU ribosomal protein S6P modification protein [Salisediminibacterium halotolerans]GEL07149.1 hypothetical protein SHA02_05650 [Salisediminibacterium halotolerans]
MAALHGWLLYNSHLQTEKFLDYLAWFKDQAEKRGIMVDAVANTQLLAQFDTFSPPLNASKDFPATYPPDFIHAADKDLILLRQLEQLGIRSYNSSGAIGICDDKRLMHEKLTQFDLPQPKTICAPMIYPGMPLTDRSHLTRIASLLGFPLVVKEAFGSFGQQVYLVRSEKELADKAEELAGKPHLYQQFISESSGEDRRLNVIGGKVAAAMLRTSANDFRANVSSGGETEQYEPTDDEKKLAVAAAKACRTDFAGVDLLKTTKGSVVCEVNSNPHIRSIYECTGIDVAEPMLDWIEATLTVKGSKS